MGELIYTNGVTAVLFGWVMWWLTSGYYQRRLRAERESGASPPVPNRRAR